MLLIILLCFGAAVTYALLRKRRIMKLLFSVPVGAENIEKIDVKQVEILNQLYEESALTIEWKLFRMKNFSIFCTTG